MKTTKAEAVQILTNLPSTHVVEILINSGAKCYQAAASDILEWLKEDAQRTIFDEDIVFLIYKSPSVSA